MAAVILGMTLAFYLLAVGASIVTGERDYRRTRHTPDYARIAALERELGLPPPEPEQDSEKGDTR